MPSVSENRIRTPAITHARGERSDLALNMRGLDLTYHLLETTPNRAAVAALIDGLADPSCRHRSVAALVGRGDDASIDGLLTAWPSLDDRDRASLRAGGRRIAAGVVRALDDADRRSSAIDAAATLGVAEAVVPLIRMIDSDADADSAGRALIAIAEPLGRAARENRGVESVRGPVLGHLAAAVRCHDRHGCDSVVDAFLVASTWTDAALRDLLGQPSAVRDLVLSRMRRSGSSSIAALVAGYLGRREWPDGIGDVLTGRSDGKIREAILATIGSAPPAGVLQNLRRTGVPASLRGWEANLDGFSPATHAALLHAVDAGGRDAVRTLELAVELMTRHRDDPDVGGHETITAVASVLGRVEPPTQDWLTRAAVPLARWMERRSDPVDTRALFETAVPHPAARLLGRLIAIADSDDGPLSRSAARLLRPLRVESMLDTFADLRPASRRRLGRVVAMIDRSAPSVLHDAARHAVAARRLAAVRAIEALDLTDELIDDLKRIVRDDSIETRMAVADVLAGAGGEPSIDLLRQLARGPQAVRSRAIRSLHARGIDAPPVGGRPS